MDLFTSKTIIPADDASGALNIGTDAGLLAKLHYFVEALEQDGRCSRLVSNIEVGDVIKIGSGANVLIDSQGYDMAHQILGKDPGIPVRKIREPFKTFLKDVQETLDFMETHGERKGKEIHVPLSTYIQHGSGNCTTFSILAQLALQRDKRDSFFVQGSVMLAGDIGIVDHAWNIVRSSDGSGGFYLADVALMAKGKITDLYYKSGFPILEVAEIKHEYSLV